VAGTCELQENRKGEKHMKLGVLNTSIATSDGIYSLRTIDLNEATALVQQAQESDGIDSAVGHAATAEVLSHLLNVDVPVNRQQFAQLPGQKALVFKLNGRIPEGQILDLEQINAIGYELKILERLS
jgi:hypothetical protein